MYQVAEGPLRACKVWEFASSPAAAFAAHLFVDMGASVEAIEPDDGSPIRQMAPFASGESTLFAYLSSGKGLRPPAKSGAASELADVNVIFHDNPLPTAWEKALHELPAPSTGRVVVVCTPYGVDGPKRDWRASELTVFQAGGEGYLMPSGLAFEEFPERPPIGIGRHVAHYQGGIGAAVAALAGLRRSRETGQTEWVDVSIQDVQLSLNYFTIVRYLDGVLENRQNRAFRYGGVLQCRDGFVELVTLEQRQWEGLRSMLGDPEWAFDEKLEDPIERARSGDEINRHLRAWAIERTVDDVVTAAAEHGVPCGPYVQPERLWDVPQLQARGFFIEDPDKPGKPFPGPPWVLDRWPKRARPAPSFSRGGD